MISKVIFLISILIPVILTTDYCEIEKKSCGLKKHIACKNNVFNRTVEPYILGTMTDDLIQIILNKLNTFRSEVAIGKYENESFYTASNLRTIRWNYEFNRLAEISLRKFPFDDFPGCVNTEEFNRTLETHHFRPNIFSNEELFNTIFNDQTADAITNDLSPYYQASIYMVGCAFGRLIDEYGKTKNLVKCIYNEALLVPLDRAYDVNIPCSKCSRFNEICDYHEIKYFGLCVPQNVTSSTSSNVLSLMIIFIPMVFKWFLLA